MTRVRGMTVKDFKDTIEDMRKLINFDDEEAKIVNLNDIQCDTNRQVDIVFERNGITVSLSKGVDLDPYEHFR